jgi:RNA polymerase sigma-70 factor (ECF subfamily)
VSDSIIPLRRTERSEASDQALLSACARGNNLALQELFHRHADGVHGFLVRTRCVDAKDLDDLVQTTFLEVQRSAKRYDARASVNTWIIGIALNIMRQYIRSERRRREAMSEVAEMPRSTGDNGPHDQVAHRQELERLQRRFDALSSNLRIVFTLIDLEGMSGGEVARLLKLREGTVWSRLHQAREALRESVNRGGRP